MDGFSNGKKLDIVKFCKDIEQQNSITTRVTPCMKKCILNAGVPEAVHVAIAIACGAACKVWATYLICQTFYAGVYGGEVTACAKKCPKPKSTIGLSCTVNGWILNTINEECNNWIREVKTFWENFYSGIKRKNIHLANTYGGLIGLCSGYYS